MKIRIGLKELAAALTEIAPIVSIKNTLLILSNVKITTKGNRVKFEGSNQQMSVRRYAEAIEIDEDGSFLVNCADLTSLIGKCRGEEIEIEVSDEIVSIKHSCGKAEFSTMNVAEYPELEVVDKDTIEITLPSSILADCIATARNFASTDEFRAVMKPIYAYVKDSEFGYCATDTCILATDRYAVESLGVNDTNWFIEPFSFGALLKACKYADNAVIKITPAQVSYRLGNTIIQTAQTQGRYPDFNRVIPKQWDKECVVDRLEFADSLKRVALFCEQSRLSSLSISTFDMTISANNLTSMKKSSETIQHDGCNGDINLGMNIDNLLRCVESCVSDKIELRMTDPSRPMLIYEIGKPYAVKLIMPMSIQH